jgi:hypothetical protein
MQHTRRAAMEVQMYPFLALALDAVGWSRTRAFYYSPGKVPLCLGEPMDVPYSYGEKKKIFSRRSHLQNLFRK